MRTGAWSALLLMPIGRVGCSISSTLNTVALLSSVVTGNAAGLQHAQAPTAAVALLAGAGMQISKAAISELPASRGPPSGEWRSSEGGVRSAGEALSQPEERPLSTGLSLNRSFPLAALQAEVNINIACIILGPVCVSLPSRAQLICWHARCTAIPPEYWRSQRHT